MMNTSNHLLNRRTFLRRTGLAATAGFAFPYFTARPLFGAAASNPVREGVRVGCIGVGNQGTALRLQNYRNIVAVCDVDSTRRNAAQKDIESRTERKCAAYTDYRKLLENKEVDAVIVATPDHWHALIAINACQAGKHVYASSRASCRSATSRSAIGPPPCVI